MYQHDDERGSNACLRGWLSDVFLPALLDREHRQESLDALTRRLGPRAGLDDPLFGRAEGLAAVEKRVGDLAQWFSERKATYERHHFTMGIERDVTESTVVLTLEQKTIEVPVAVVAEKRRSREVEVRLYLPLRALGEGRVVRAVRARDVRDPRDSRDSPATGDANRPAVVPHDESLPLPTFMNSFSGCPRPRRCGRHSGAVRK